MTRDILNVFLACAVGYLILWGFICFVMFLGEKFRDTPQVKIVDPTEAIVPMPIKKK